MQIYRTADGWLGSERGHFFRLNADRIADLVDAKRGEEVAQPSELLVPTTPTKVVCVGLNYRAHAEEMNKQIPDEPLLFMKPTTALLPHHGTVELPPQSGEVHHEAELAVVIGRTAKRVSVDDVQNVILGYTIANDVTARDIQRREKRYTRAKGFDTFCPLGPHIVTANTFTPSEHAITLEVNGQERQRSSLDDFIFDIPTVVSFVSHVMTLNPGDVVLTGTPAGVGPMKTNDAIKISIDGIGSLQHGVR